MSASWLGEGACPAAASSPSRLLLPLNPGERSEHVASPRRAWQRLLGMLSGQDPLEWRVRNRWPFPGSAFPGSGPGPGLLCARSRSRRCLLAGPSDPRCRLACPLSAVNLAARPEEERGGAGPAGRRPGGQEGPAPGRGGCGESRGGWGAGAGAESRGWGHRRWLWAANREGRGPWGRLGGTSPGRGAAATPGAGPGLSGLRRGRRGPHLPAVAGVCGDCCCRRHRPGCHLLLFLLLLGRAGPLPAAASSWAGPAASRPLAEPLPPPPHSSSCTIGGTGTKMSNRVVCREASHAGSWYTASGRAPGRPARPQPPRLAPRPARGGPRPCPARRGAGGTAWGGSGPRAGLTLAPELARGRGAAPGRPRRPLGAGSREERAPCAPGPEPARRLRRRPGCGRPSAATPGRTACRAAEPRCPRPRPATLRPLAARGTRSAALASRRRRPEPRGVLGASRCAPGCARRPPRGSLPAPPAV